MNYPLQYLCFTFLIGLSVAAYALTSPPVNVPITITPSGGGGVACDNGPNYTGTIPAGASAVGFTHCLANLDFTSAALSNPSTYIQCPGNTPATPLLFTHGFFSNPACSDAVIATDPVNGNSALKVSFTTADYNAGNQETEINSINQSFPGFGYNNNGPGFYFPMAVYFDATMRADSTTDCPGCSSGYENALFDIFWNGPNSGTSVNGNTNPFVEHDLAETTGGGGATYGPGAFEWNACGGSSCYPLSGFNGWGSTSAKNTQTQYWTYGARFMQTSAGAIADCSYLNDSQIGCGSGSYQNGGSDVSITQQNHIILWEGGEKAVGTECNGSCDPGSNPQISWYKSIVIWVCSDYATNPTCVTSSVDTGTP